MSEKKAFTITMWKEDSDTLSQYAALLSHVYKREISPQHLLWKHSNNPLGPSLISYAKNNDGDVVAARAFWRMFSRDAIIYQPCDTVTHPNFQRKGLFSSLTTLCLNHVEDKAVIVNFPNHNSYPAYLKLGWRKYADNKRVFGFNIKSSSAPINAVSDYFDTQFDDTQARYLKWRFSADSGKHYRCFKHKHGVVIDNGSMQGLILNKPSVHAYGKKSGKNQGYVLPTHFNAGMGALSLSIALPCSSRTAYFLQPQADIKHLDNLFASAQVNTLMDTF
jgi:hypothetical protein